MTTDHNTPWTGALSSASTEKTSSLNLTGHCETLIEYAPVGVYRVSPEGRVLMANPALAHIFGYSSTSELLSVSGGMGLPRHPADDAVHRQFVDAVKREGDVRGYESIWHRKDGSIAHLRLSAHVVRDAEGRPVYFEGTVEDLSERSRIEEELRDSREWFQALIEGSSDIVTVVDEHGVILYEAPAVRAVLGYEPDERTGRNILDFIHPDDVPHVIGALDEFAADPDAVIHREVRALHQGGGYRWVEATARSFLNHPGVCGIVINTRDITERRRTMDYLRESEDRFRGTFDDSPIGAALVSLDGYWMRVNSALCHIMGRSEADIIGTMYLDLMHPDDRDLEMPQLSALLAGEITTFDMYRRYLHADGHTVWAWVHVSLVHTAEGRPDYYLTHFQDITEIRVAEEALRASEERVRAMLEHSSDVVTVLDASGTVIYDAPSLVSQLGYTPEERIGQSAFDLTHPDDAEAVRASFQSLIACPGKVDSQPIRVRHKNGTWRILSVTARNLLDHPAIRGVVLNSRDITDQHAAVESLRKSEAHFRHLWELSVEGMRLVDQNGIIVMVNQAYCDIFGKSEAELLGQPYHIVYGDVTDLAMTEIRERIANKDIPTHLCSDAVLWDGRRITIDVTFTLLEVEGQPPMVLSSFRDVTEQKKDAETLTRYRLLAENSTEAILIVNQDGQVVDANTGAERAYGYSQEELRSMSVQQFRASPGESPLLARLRQPNFTPYVYESVNLRRDGSTFPVEVSLQSALIGSETLFMVTCRDITERRALEKQLAHQAFHDALTGLPNRALFMDRLQHALTASARRSDRVGMLFMDIDRFKIINDSLGHPAGDQLLVAIAARLQSCIRTVDTAARFGGDEFTVLLEGIQSQGEATMSAERILRHLETPFEIDGQEVYITASVGVALSGDEEQTASDLIRDADIAMYEAKTEGKAKHAVAHRISSADVRERLQLETDLRRAVERDEFQVYYQPIVLLETQRTIGVEALVRWNHPRFGIMPPDGFVPVQEQIGLIEPFTMWVLREAQAQCLAWQRSGIFLTTSVNLSVHNLHQPRFAEKVADMLRATGLTPSALKLEVTESAVMMNPTLAIETLGELNAMGVRLSIDDFGTGCSSLTYLKQLPVHEIKIDKSFVLGMDQNDDDDAAIVRATISLAHNLRKKVVAEGVESRTVWNLLNLLGCDAAQGFYMGRPMPVDELAKWLVTSEFGLRI